MMSKVLNQAIARSLKIGIYSESQHAANGGSEFCVGVLAAALSEAHDVEIVHHRADMDAAKLAEHCHVDLSRVQMRYVLSDPMPPVGLGNLQRYFRETARWNADISAPYDVFVTFSHLPPPMCRARKGVMVVLFPHKIHPALGRYAILEAVKSAISRFAYRSRLQGYQVKTAISEFSREWTARYWGVGCEILHPPVDTEYETVQKEPLIVSVARFTELGVSKHQREMVCTFRQLEAASKGFGWQYACAGGLSSVAEDRRYFDEVWQLAQGYSVKMLPSIKRNELINLYERGAIFWHAAGYGQDVAARPAAVEHFGITTVEAMAAGCVPVVIRKGGQTEIVEHGVSGFLWETLGELEEYTTLLMRDAVLRARMSEAARARARLFSRHQFVSRFCTLAGVSLGGPEDAR